jgi:predicted class III extradiol MEMO1 family dioxygenase
LFQTSKIGIEPAAGYRWCGAVCAEQALQSADLIG